TTRVRSTPSSSKIRCWSSPVRCAAFVCVVMKTPVVRCAQAIERSTRSTSSVTPGASVQHLSAPARTPVSPIPCSISRTKSSVSLPDELRDLVAHLALDEEDVLVHVDGAEVVDLDGAADGLNGHSRSRRRQSRHLRSGFAASVEPTAVDLTGAGYASAAGRRD